MTCADDPLRTQGDRDGQPRRPGMGGAGGSRPELRKDRATTRERRPDAVGPPPRGDARRACRAGTAGSLAAWRRPGRSTRGGAAGPGHGEEAWAQGGSGIGDAGGRGRHHRPGNEPGGGTPIVTGMPEVAGPDAWGSVVPLVDLENRFADRWTWQFLPPSDPTASAKGTGRWVAQGHGLEIRPYTASLCTAPAASRC